MGQRFAIHAGKSWDPAGLEFIRDLGFDCPEDPAAHPLGIVGTVRLTGVIEPRGGLPERSLFSP